jgi:3-oxoacyl-[acyl-carrier-protein] synthase-3
MSGGRIPDGVARAWISGAAHALPLEIVTNEDLPASLGVDPAGIFKRTGIRARHWAKRGVRTSDLGAEAARNLFARLGTDGRDIDCIIAGTQTPDHFIPGIGVLIQEQLGLANIPCFDVRDQCSGFLYGLQMARAFIATGTYRRILLLCAELHSHGLGRDPEDAHITPLFGDGAGAVLVTDRPEGAVPLTPVWLTLGADGRGAPRLRHRLWDIGLIPPWHPEQFSEPAHQIQYAEMDGEAVFRAAVKRMAEVGKSGFKALGISAQDVDWLLPHQANANISKTVASILDFPPERVLGNIERVGNCSGASLPILLSEVMEASTIGRGQRVMMVAFGAGFTWGGAVLEAAP